MLLVEPKAHEAGDANLSIGLSVEARNFFPELTAGRIVTGQEEQPREGQT